MQMRRGELWVSSSAWCEKGMMRKPYKNALRICRVIKERACVHCFWLAKPLGIWYHSVAAAAASAAAASAAAVVMYSMYQHRHHAYDRQTYNIYN